MTSGIETQNDLYKTGFLIRALENRLLGLFAEGKLNGTVHTCLGQEWTGIAVASALNDGDYVVCNHRGHGHYISFTQDIDGLMAELMGRESGVAHGFGGSQHLAKDGFFSNGILGGMVPISVGLAASHAYAGRSGIAVAFMGDGALGEGIVYESLNLASLRNAPLLLIVENNGYAQSTPQSQFLSGSIAGRAAAFGVRTEYAETWSPESLLATTAECVAYVRENRRPLLLEIGTYRLAAHSKGDDDRDPAEVADYYTKDPITQFSVNFPDLSATYVEEAERAVDRAVAAAEESLPAATLPHRASPARPAPVAWQPASKQTSDRVVAQINATLRANMANDDRIIVMGEDVADPYGGAFKVTRGLSTEFPDRVHNMPISEASIVGFGTGLALGGFKPVCELMFGDFLLLVADQLVNHASKLHDMYGHHVPLPLVVRTPMGGKRGYGPTHSQSTEKHFLGIPGLTVVAINARMDIDAVYSHILQHSDNPTLIIENKLLYGETGNSDTIPVGFQAWTDGADVPCTLIASDLDPAVTILCYGGMLSAAEAAASDLFINEEIVCEIVCPAQLYPLDLSGLADSLSRTHHLVIVEEGQNFAAFGAEVVARIMESNPVVLARVKRIGAHESSIASARGIESAQLPGESHIISGVLELLKGNS